MYYCLESIQHNVKYDILTVYRVEFWPWNLKALGNGILVTCVSVRTIAVSPASTPYSKKCAGTLTPSTGVVATTTSAHTAWIKGRLHMLQRSSYHPLRDRSCCLYRPTRGRGWFIHCTTSVILCYYYSTCCYHQYRHNCPSHAPK